PNTHLLPSGDGPLRSLREGPGKAPGWGQDPGLRAPDLYLARALARGAIRPCDSGRPGRLLVDEGVAQGPSEARRFHDLEARSRLDCRLVVGVQRPTWPGCRQVARIGAVLRAAL